MKGWIISDTHFGVKNNSKQWMNMFSEYFDDFFIPMFEKYGGEDDVLIHCGDVFDNQQTIGVGTMNFAISTFEKLAKRFKRIYIICGNHDICDIHSNEVSSLECLKHINGVEVLKSQKDIKLGNSNISLLPWNVDMKELTSQIKDCYDSDYIFCHAEVYGATMNSSKTKSQNGVDSDSIQYIHNIFSGHIHHQHKHKNVTFIGSPYHLTENDIGNQKGFYIIDFDNKTEQFVENRKSPEYVRYDYNDIKDCTFGEFKEMCKNKYANIRVDSELLKNLYFQKIFSYINKEDAIKNLEFTPIANEAFEMNKNMNISECVSLEDMLNKYIDEVVIGNDKLKTSIKAISKKLLYG